MNAYIDRGVASEKLVEQALLLIKNGPSRAYPPITDVFHSAKNSSLDRKKADFLIRFAGIDEPMPLQAKSSSRSAHKFASRCKRRGFEVPVVVVNPEMAIDVILDHVDKCIRQFFAVMKHCSDRWMAYVRGKLPRPSKRRQQRHAYRMPAGAYCR